MQKDLYEWYKIFESEEEAKKQIKLNKMKSFRFGLKKVCVGQNQDGLFAVEDACPHKMIPLTQGSINEKGEIVCFWHKYTFEVKTGEEKTGKIIRNLKIFPLENREDGLYVGIIKYKPSDEFSF